MKDTLYQISLLQAFINGYYDGVENISELKKYGDIGIGTFEGADGEMIMLDSKVYKAKFDGTIALIEEGLTPFCNVCKFICKDKIKTNIDNVNQLKTLLNRYRDMNYKNLFIVIKIKGLFKNISVRSVPKQNKPYNPFEEVIEHDQKIYTYKNVEGTLIGFLFPRYLKELNTTDLHMHFLSKDLSCGGHVLDLSFNELTIETSIKSDFNLILPNNDKFNNHNVVVNNTIIKKVEE